MDPSESTTVKLKGLSYSATIEDLEALFEPCGEVEGVTISSDRGEVAYVNFASPEGAANVGSTTRVSFVLNEGRGGMSSV